MSEDTSPCSSSDTEKNELCPVCYEVNNKPLLFPYCKHVICTPCGVRIAEHTFMQMNIRCPMCRRRMWHGLRLF